MLGEDSGPSQNSLYSQWGGHHGDKSRATGLKPRVKMGTCCYWQGRNSGQLVKGRPARGTGQGLSVFSVPPLRSVSSAFEFCLTDSSLFLSWYYIGISGSWNNTENVLYQLKAHFLILKLDVWYVSSSKKRSWLIVFFALLSLTEDRTHFPISNFYHCKT